MKKYKFKARIESAPRGGAYILFPYDTGKEFATKGKVPVNATIDGVEYSGSLVKYGHPQHMLGILKTIRQQIGKGPGEMVDIVLWKDEDLRVVEINDAFKERMKREALLTFFESLSYTHRKEYCRWITEAKREETRLKRLDKAMEMLKLGVRTPG
ncbi:MAG TPA: YdeI/OmpD-associated family protein [Acidisarcina sp.]